MARYIDADELLKKAIYPFIESDMKVVTVEDIKSAPTADVKPIVRGKWKYKLIQPSHCVSDMEMTCTQCYAVIRRKHGELFNFCPNCGADMRWKNEEEE